MTLLTTTWTDDDGSGSVGTIINAAQLASIYQNMAHADAHVAGGRVTLSTGVPVTTVGVTGATTLYYSPYFSDVIALFDGTATWNPISFAETSIAVPATTSQMYDIFAFNNSGSLALELLAWTNDTTRATALTYQNGIYVKTGFSTRRYLGSFRTTGVSGQTEDSFSNRFVWNYQNRVRRPLRRVETTASWALNSVWQQANAAAANQVNFILGLNEDPVEARVLHLFSNAAAVNVGTAIGLDSTTAVHANCVGGFAQPGAAGAADFTAVQCEAEIYAGIGKHSLMWLEASNAACTAYGTNLVANGQANGIYATLIG